MNTLAPRIMLTAMTVLLFPGSSVLIAAQRDAELRLTLSVDQVSYAPYEPVVVRYELANNSSSPVEVPNFVDHHSGYLTFEVAQGEAEFRPFRTGPQACGPYATTTLPAGDRLSGQMTIVANAYGRLAKTSLSPEYKGLQQYPFAEAGKFRIRASYSLAPPAGSAGAPPKISSDTVNVVVRAMTAEEKKQFAFFSGPADYSSAVGASAESDDLAADIKRWKAFAEQFPASVYAPAISLNLGTLFLDGTGLPASDAGSAKTSFTATLRSRKLALHGDALLGLARANLEQGLTDDAKTTVARGLAEALTTEQRIKFSSLQERLGGPPK